MKSPYFKFFAFLFLYYLQVENICLTLQTHASPSGERGRHLYGKWRFQTLIFKDTNFATSNPKERLGNDKRLR